MGNSDSLTDPMKLRSPLYPPVAVPAYKQAGCSASARVSRATPYGFPCVSTLIPREVIYRLWQLLLGQMHRPSSNYQRVGTSNFIFTRLHVGSLSLRPAGLLASLNETLSGNLMLQVTLYTSLALRGRTAEFPRPDFNWQVMCPTRHTVKSLFEYKLS